MTRQEDECGEIDPEDTHSGKKSLTCLPEIYKDVKKVDVEKEKIQEDEIKLWEENCKNCKPLNISAEERQRRNQRLGRSAEKAVWEIGLIGCIYTVYR